HRNVLYHHEFVRPAGDRHGGFQSVSVSARICLILGPRGWFRADRGFHMHLDVRLQHGRSPEMG
ncbi:MAG TPA: hypothetical protein VKU01_07730, partial [Bryobacteraceae bacterium]|nr:hypothetical protein [Bryobacteraceae bacterium]